MLAALSLTLASNAVAQQNPVLLGFDVVEYFSLPANASGVQGSALYQANLTSTDMTNNTIKMEVRPSVVCMYAMLGIEGGLKMRTFLK